MDLIVSSTEFTLFEHVYNQSMGMNDEYFQEIVFNVIYSYRKKNIAICAPLFALIYRSIKKKLYPSLNFSISKSKNVEQNIRICEGVRHECRFDLN